MNIDKLLLSINLESYERVGSMKVQGLLFACCLGMSLVLAFAFTIEERPAVKVLDIESGETSISYRGHGVAHPDYATLLRGESGKERHEHILWLGWFFGILVSTLFVACLAFGARRNDVVGPIKVPIAIGGVIYLIIWTVMVWTYRDYMNGSMDGRFLALPIPLAWMVYGFWLFPAFFIVLFVVKYEEYFWDEESESKFKEILEAKKRREEGAA